MKRFICAIIVSLIFCVLQAGESRAATVFGHSGIVYDSANGVVRGYSRTEVDYETAAYYSPSVCGSILVNGIERVRACRGGMLSATVNTQIAGAPDHASLISDHYIDMVFYDEGNMSYEDVYGYSFLPGYSYPLDAFFNAPGVSTQRQPVSIRVGATTTQAMQPQVFIEGYSFEPMKIKKEGGHPPGDTTTFKIRIGSSDSEALQNAEVTVSIGRIMGGASLRYFPGQTNVRPLARNDFTDVPFTISTNADNQYVGMVQYRIFIVKVVDRTTGMDISANIKIRPQDGLPTNATVVPPTNPPTINTLTIVP